MKKNKISNILVTGGAGFIGSALCKELVSQGHQVTSLDNYSNGSSDKGRLLEREDKGRKKNCQTRLSEKDPSEEMIANLRRHPPLTDDFDIADLQLNDPSLRTEKEETYPSLRIKTEPTTGPSLRFQQYQAHDQPQGSHCHDHLFK